MKKAREEGTELAPPLDRFNAEVRDPSWAPAMERQLATWVEQSEAIFAAKGLVGVVVEAPNCRESMCELTLTYPESAVEQARQSGLFQPRETPFGYLTRTRGPLSEVITEYSPDTVRNSDGSRSYHKSVFLNFGEEDSDPARHAAWVQRTQELLQRRQAERMGQR